MSRKLFASVLMAFLFSFGIVTAAMYPSGWSCEDITCTCVAERCYYPGFENYPQLPSLAYQDEIINYADIAAIEALPHPPKPEWWLVEGRESGIGGSGLVTVVSAYDEKDAREKFREEVTDLTIGITYAAVAKVGVQVIDKEGWFLVDDKGYKVYAPQESRGEKWYIDPKKPGWAWNPGEEKWVPSSQVPFIAELEEGSASPPQPAPQAKTTASSQPVQKGTLGAKVEGGNIYESTPVSPASSVLAAENCLSSQRCNEIDEVWLKIVAWVNNLRKELVWNTALGDWKQKARPEVTLKPGVTGAAAAIRQNIKKAAEAEYARWDNGARRESESQMTPIVVSYFEAGGSNCAKLNPVVDPWSAAFVSYVMKNAGVTSFPGRCAHTQYFKAVHDSPGACRTYPMSERGRIGIGDVVCRCRPSETEKCSGDYNNAYGNSHCDVVVNVIGGGKVEVIGGNVNDNVEKRVLDVNVDEASDKKWYGFISCEGAATKPSALSSTNFCVAAVGTNEQKALLDTIAWAEGTREKYSVMFGGKQFTTYAAHPVETGEMSEKGITVGSYTSTAAGRYQFLYSTYKDLKEQGYFQKSFQFVEQDTAALEGLIIKKRGLSEEALKSAVNSGNFELIWDKLAPEWASLPYSPKSGQSYYGQPVQKSSDLVNIYQACLQFHKTGVSSGSPSVSTAGPAPISVQGAVIPFKNPTLEKACKPESLACNIPTQNVGKQEVKVNAQCLPGMVKVGSVCIDQYEALLIDKNSGEVWSPYCAPGKEISRLRSVSIEGVIPQSAVSQLQAQQACANAGKRLCTADEWQSTCQGTAGSKYPYGASQQKGACNDQLIYALDHPTLRTVDNYCPNWEDYTSASADGKKYYTQTPWMLSPITNQLSGTLATAGSFQGCKTPEQVYDLVGNLDEWVGGTVSCKAGTCGSFLGGFYARSERSSDGTGGCTYITEVHAPSYSDYSLGFRCCADPLS